MRNMAGQEKNRCRRGAVNRSSGWRQTQVETGVLNAWMALHRRLPVDSAAQARRSPAGPSNVVIACPQRICGRGPSSSSPANSSSHRGGGGLNVTYRRRQSTRCGHDSPRQPWLFERSGSIFRSDIRKNCRMGGDTLLHHFNPTGRPS